MDFISRNVDIYVDKSFCQRRLSVTSRIKLEPLLPSEAGKGERRQRTQRKRSQRKGEEREIGMETDSAPSRRIHSLSGSKAKDRDNVKRRKQQRSIYR